MPPHGRQAVRRSTSTKPELAGLLPVLYPGVFPNLAAYKKPRADLVAILLTGIPKGVVPGFQNYTGPVQADMLRLNVAVPPSKSPNPLGLVAGDAAGFPNGRRVFDDVVTVELRAVAGLTIPLVDPSFTPDGAAGRDQGRYVEHERRLPDRFPYLGTPAGGYQSKPGTPARMSANQVENPHAGKGSSVLLDIGGDVGALVVDDARGARGGGDRATRTAPPRRTRTRTRTWARVAACRSGPADFAGRAGHPFGGVLRGNSGQLRAVRSPVGRGAVDRRSHRWGSHPREVVRARGSGGPCLRGWSRRLWRRLRLPGLRGIRG